MPSTSIPMTLPAKYYTDPEIFRSEMERFFFGRWIYAGRAEKIAKPGDYFLCTGYRRARRSLLQRLQASRDAHVHCT
jgi:phenylpropionate dioxygenase-like ring-hydroxylating dioxygenase large terminal subunit